MCRFEILKQVQDDPPSLYELRKGKRGMTKVPFPNGGNGGTGAWVGTK